MNKKTMNKLHFIVTSLVIVFVVSLSIGFSSFNTEMSISGIVSDVRPVRDVRITDLKLVENTGDTYVGNVDYTADKMFFEFTLNDHFAKLVYEVEVTVFGSQIISFDGFEFNGTFVPVSYDGIGYGTKICDTSEKCTLGAKKKYRIIFTGEAGDFNFSMKAHYLNVYNITYQGVPGSYQTEIIEGNNLSVQFPSGYNQAILLEGGTEVPFENYSFNNNLLFKRNVTGDLVISLSSRLYGDAVEDGIINSRDTLFVARAVNGLENPTGYDFVFSDINGDNKLDSVDYELIRLVSVDRYPAGYQPLTDYTRYGDVNEDNIVNITDSEAVLSYLKGTTSFSEQQLINADINDSGDVTEIDYELILAVAKGSITHLIVQPVIDYPHYGDVDIDDALNGKDYTLIQQYLEDESVLSGDQLVWADINADGIINGVDATLVMGIINGYIKHSILSPLTDYVLYGDANNDGSVGLTDMVRINGYINGTMVLSEQELKNADVNGDGVVTSADSDIVKGIVLGTIKDTSLPYAPYKN